jgi:hypothetical protein
MPINRNIQQKININPVIIQKQVKQFPVNNQIMSNIIPKNKIKRSHIIPHKNKNNKLKRIWNNEIVYIIGGGPSLKNFNWDELKGKHLIAINKAYTVLPWAEVLYWTDSRFYRWNKSDIDKLKCLKVTCRNSKDLTDDIVLLTVSGKEGIDKRPNFIKAGNNSGFAAINVAYHLGAKRIYLLGFDMSSNDKDTHWHEGYGIQHDHSIYKRSMIGNFNGIFELLKSEDIDIWNANPMSQLNSIPKCKLKDALNDCSVQIS